MTGETTARGVTDAQLVAYLDGELSPADSVRIGQAIAADTRLADRLAHLMRGARPFREAFDPLLAEAPVDRLAGLLDAAMTRPVPTGSSLARRRLWPAAVAAAVLLLGIGAALDRLATLPPRASMTSSLDDTEEWRRVVTQYLSLYTPETLVSDATADAPRLSRLGDRFGLALIPSRVALPDLTLKRADLYAYDGKPLAFLAYLGPEGGPVALCITQGPGGGKARQVGGSHGMNVVTWSAGGHGFMLVGQAPVERLEALAAIVAARFDG